MAAPIAACMPPPRRRLTVPHASARLPPPAPRRPPAAQVIVNGAAGRVGRAVVAAIAAARGLELVGAVDRRCVGEDAGTVAGLAEPLELPIIDDLPVRGAVEGRGGRCWGGGKPLIVPCCLRRLGDLTVRGVVKGRRRACVGRCGGDGGCGLLEERERAAGRSRPSQTTRRCDGVGVGALRGVCGPLRVREGERGTYCQLPLAGWSSLPERHAVCGTCPCVAHHDLRLRPPHLHPPLPPPLPARQVVLASLSQARRSGVFVDFTSPDTVFDDVKQVRGGSAPWREARCTYYRSSPCKVVSTAGPHVFSDQSRLLSTISFEGIEAAQHHIIRGNRGCSAPYHSQPSFP